MSYPSRFVEFFGPATWKAIHSIAFNYPENPTEEQKKTYSDFFTNFSKVIPCPACSKHFQEFIKNNPIKTDSREELSRWVYDSHSEVNKMNKKPNPSFLEVKEKYTSWGPKQLMSFNKLSQNEKDTYLAATNLNLTTDNLIKEKEFVDYANSQNLILVFFIFISVFLFYYFYKKRLKLNKN